MKQCPTCKTLYAADDDFCPTDGSPLINAAPVSPQGTPTQVIKTPVRAPLSPGGGNAAPWIYVIAGAFGAAIIIGGIYLFSANGGGGGGGGGKTVNDNRVNAARSSEEKASAVNLNKIAGAATPTPTAAISPTGHWTGDWSSPSGAYLTIVVDLDDDGKGGISGRIEWTLRRTRRPEKMSKIGMSAIEYVNGRFDPATRALTMQGYRKDDPNNVLVMVDSYRLTLSGDNRKLNGSARNGGKWNAAVNLSR